MATGNSGRDPRAEQEYQPPSRAPMPAQQQSMTTADWRAVGELNDYYRRWLTGLARQNPNRRPPPRPRPRPRPAAAAQSAEQLVKMFLDERGLGTLAAWAWQRWKELGMIGDRDKFQVIEVEMVERQEFKDRFPAYDYFRKQGNAIPVDKIRDYEIRARDSLNRIGARDTYSNQDIQKIMMGGVSSEELDARVNAALVAADSPALAASELKRMYNLPTNVLAQFFLDPDRTMVDIQKMWESGQIGAMSIDAGFGELTTTEAERIAAGTSTDQAANRFAEMGQASGIFDTQVGDAISVGRNEMVGFAAGETAAARAVNRRAQSRRAAYAGSAGFQASRTGVTGLGDAS